MPILGIDHWENRVRDPDLFSKIRTPIWASRAGTKMAKQWIIASSYDFSISPDQVQDQLLDSIELLDHNGNPGMVLVRRGLSKQRRWLTQSVLVPRTMQLQHSIIAIPYQVSQDISCYIASRLDPEDEPSLCS